MGSKGQLGRFFPAYWIEPQRRNLGQGRSGPIEPETVRVKGRSQSFEIKIEGDFLAQGVTIFLNQGLEIINPFARCGMTG